MLALSIQTLIGLMWLAFWALSTIVVVCLFGWALRTHQFRNQKHAANLPLEAGDLEGDDEPADGEEQKE